MKTKKAMKKITIIGMAALVAMGMLGTSCNKVESQEMETPATPKDNIVTLTTTVGFAEADTKALTGFGVKTFAEGEKMALRYKNKKGDWVKAVSNALEVGDIADGSKSATFTFTLTNPDKTKNVDYIYPAAIVNELGNMDEAALFGSQDGTLNKIASTFDYSRKIGSWDGENLPSLTLENQLAILAITLKNADGSSDITSNITGLTLSDGTKTYNVTREAVAGPIYVAIFPTEDATITVTATDDTKNYTKTLTGKTYAKGNGYSVSWRMYTMAADATTSDLGKLICADGHVHVYGEDAECTATRVAIIAYVGTAGSVDASSTTYKGLAIAMSDANGGSTCAWYTDNSGTCVSQSNAISTARDYKNGIASTTTLTSDGHTHAAATAAASNNGTAAPTGTSGWFLPSIGQWNLIVQGLATKKAGSAVTTNLTTSSNSTYNSSNLNSVITDAGGTGFQSNLYWSSTECSTSYAWRMNFSYGLASSYRKTDNYYVRSALAF